MKQKISRQETEKKISEFFEKVKSKTPREIKKIKKLAMSKNIQLKEKRKSFCKKCFVAFSGKEKIRIRDEIKSITCENCGNVARIKLSI